MLSVLAENRSPGFYNEAQRQIVQKENGTIMTIPEISCPLISMVKANGRTVKPAVKTEKGICNFKKLLKFKWNARLVATRPAFQDLLDRNQIFQACW